MKLVTKKQKFKSKKEAYTALLIYLAAPFVLAGGVFTALTGRFLRPLYTESSQRQAILIGLIAVGVALIFSWYKMFRLFFLMNSKEYDTLPDGIPDTVLCIKCQEPFAGRNLQTMICPKCGGSLEDLTGFYDRHPELKDITKNAGI